MLHYRYPWHFACTTKLQATTARLSTALGHWNSVAIHFHSYVTCTSVDIRLSNHCCALPELHTFTLYTWYNTRKEGNNLINTTYESRSVSGCSLFSRQIRTVWTRTSRRSTRRLISLCSLQY